MLSSFDNTLFHPVQKNEHSCYSKGMPIFFYFYKENYFLEALEIMYATYQANVQTYKLFVFNASFPHLNIHAYDPRQFQYFLFEDTEAMR